MIGRSTHILRILPVGKALLVINPVLPMLRGLPKAYKPGISLQLIVSYVSAPTYLLAKFLHRWFKSFVLLHFLLFSQELSEPC